jgi:Ras-related C3 botulinum toxin substrate 1
MKHIKCVVVGDGAVGKTCLLLGYATNAFPVEYIPTVFDNYLADILVDDQQIHLQLWDTAGQEDYKKLRPLSYPQTDIFIICFSLVSPTSLENIETMWIPELKQHCPNAPFILVGMKSDLRDSLQDRPDNASPNGMRAVSWSSGEEVKKRIEAHAYVECSARTQYHMHEVFDTAVRVALHPPSATPTRKGKENAAGVGGCCLIL